MTDNKRFIIPEYTARIVDIVENKEYPMSSYRMHIVCICDVLNNLSDENKHLKQQDKINEDCYKTLLQKYDDLKKENEQLKKENNALKNIIRDFIIKEFKITKEDIINGKGGDATDFSSVIDEFFNNEVNISEIQVELKGEKKQ